jgi:hypothetical protein
MSLLRASAQQGILHSIPLATILPESLRFYLALMMFGFMIGVIGHVVGSKPIVAVGILMVFLATLLLPVALNLFSDRPEFPRIQQP